MHKKGALLLLIFLVIVIIISLIWKDETPVEVSIPVENTTEMLTTKETSTEEENRFKVGEITEEIPAPLPEEKNIEEAVPEKETNITVSKSATETFTLVSPKGNSQQVTLSDQKITLLQSNMPLVMVNIFATWCPPCIGQIAHLNDLQKKYQNELFIAGVLTHDTIDKTSLETLMAKEQANYFISYSNNNDAFATLLAQSLQLEENFPIPLSIIYVNGQYFTHYEGIVPVEMIEYDIQQAKKLLNSR